jgi:hypothetical protein
MSARLGLLLWRRVDILDGRDQVSSGCCVAKDFIQIGRELSFSYDTWVDEGACFVSDVLADERREIGEEVA